MVLAHVLKAAAACVAGAIALGAIAYGLLDSRRRHGWLLGLQTAPDGGSMRHRLKTRGIFTVS